jgi:membrane-bound serine protease (ClpP class)
VDFAEFASEPAVVYVAVVLAAALLITEVALPTVGVAGLSSLILTGVAIFGINEGDIDWWPLSLAAVAVGLWSVMVARRKAPVGQQVVAAAAFAVGSVTFAIIEEDALTLVLAVAGSIALPLAFPVLFRQTERLLGQQPVVGLESFIGHTATVVEWHGGRGTVRIEGSRWNAAGATNLQEGDAVVITAHEGMCFTVQPAAPRTGGMPMTMPTQAQPTVPTKPAPPAGDR